MKKITKEEFLKVIIQKQNKIKSICFGPRGGGHKSLLELQGPLAATHPPGTTETETTTDTATRAATKANVPRDRIPSAGRLTPLHSDVGPQGPMSPQGPMGFNDA